MLEQFLSEGPAVYVRLISPVCCDIEVSSGLICDIQPNLVSIPLFGKAHMIIDYRLDCKLAALIYLFHFRHYRKY
jgi:hypothetical protein